MRTRAVLYAFAVLLAGTLTAAWVGATAPRAGLALLIVGALVALALALIGGWWWPASRLGSDEKTARTLAERAPELNFDLLAAVELSHALGNPRDFSPDLARAFLRDVNRRAAKVPLDLLVDSRPASRAARVFLAVVLLSLTVLVFKGARVRDGAAKLLAGTAPAALLRTPITGDVELLFNYPAHTGLSPRTVPSATGDITAPVGTEVTWRARADRDVRDAALLLGEQRVPLTVEGRRLTGQFIVEDTQTFHVAFFEGRRAVAEGPDQTLIAEPDQVPQVRLLAPDDALELMPEKQQATLLYDASDDYGLTALDLVYSVEGGGGGRTSLRPDDGRTTRGTYVWDLTPLSLTPGQVVTYQVEATDNDAVKGPKKASSAQQTLKLYSDAEHKAEALARTEALWFRLIDHLADRMEAPDRRFPVAIDDAVTGKPNDERAAQLAGDFVVLVDDLQKLRDPPTSLLAALLNVSGELQKDTSRISSQRRFLLRLTGREAAAPGTTLADTKDGAYAKQLSRQLTLGLADDIAHTEKNVLYLEALLDRQRLDAIRELVENLRHDRQELSRLLEEFARAPDTDVQQALLKQMEALKQRMMEIQQRMAELTKGLRDDFMNQEALAAMQEELDMKDALSEIEQLIREGKTDEAQTKMQELAMQLDEFANELEDAADRADEQSDPELARQYEEFTQKLDETVSKQQQVADQTRALRDRARARQKEKIARQGEALKAELKNRLQELEKSWSQVEGQRLGYRFDEERKEALAARENVEQALDANDFDLASEAADQMESSAEAMADRAKEQHSRDELFHNPQAVQNSSKQNAEKLVRDAKKAREVAKKLRDLFPQPGQAMSDGEKQQLSELAKQQRQLQQQGQELMQQMEQLGERAPIFSDDAQQQLSEAQGKMQSAAEMLGQRDANRGHGEQQGALQSLEALKDSMQQQGKGKGNGRGLPMPGRRQGGGRGGQRDQKVELPPEDPAQAQREFRKDVMDAMKQGVPDRYREQTRRYYEELVK